MFSEFAILLLMSAVAGWFALWLRQPVLISYILVGILVGPAALGFVSAHSPIDLLAQVGVTILLFLVGLKLDLKHVREIGKVALATGLGQLFFTILFGFFIVIALGKPWLEALYIAVALTFSSTIIIVKLLTDKKEIDQLHGRIAVGFLIVQDIAVVVAMMAMSTFGVSNAESVNNVFLVLSVKLLVAGLSLFVVMRYLLPSLVARMASSQELLLIFCIAWGTALAAVGEWAGFSREAGAFLAGFSLASTQFREAISVRLVGVRDFLLLFFFIDLGSKLDLTTLGDEVVGSLILSIFVLIGNPLIVMLIMGYMGYRSRTGFLCGLTVAQISEFSIIFIAMGISLGHVSQNALGITTLVGIVTIATSTYMIMYSQQIYKRLAPVLQFFERKAPTVGGMGTGGENSSDEKTEVIVVGLGRYGRQLSKRLQKNGVKVLGIEFDPAVVSEVGRDGSAVLYADALLPEIWDVIPLNRARWIVITLPSAPLTYALLQRLAELNFPGQLAVLGRESFDQDVLKELGATHVFYPLTDAVDFAASTLTQIIKGEEPS